MKRSFQILALLLFLFSISASAQPYIGVFVGGNGGKLSGDAPDKGSYKSLIGINVGANLDLKLGKNTWLSIQPSYSQEGTRVFYSVKGQEKSVDSIHIRLNYFSLPLFLKVTSNNERFYALGGVETAYLLDSYVSSHGVEQETDIKISEWNVAVHFGAGYRIPLGLPRLYIELRYSQGLINLTDEPVNESYIPRVKTSGFKILAGIEVPLKKVKN